MQQPITEQASGHDLFTRVLVGIDGSAAARVAAEQAARLVTHDGTVELATAIYLVDAGLQHWPDEEIAATLEREGRPRLDAVATAAGSRATTRLLNGPPRQALLEEAKRLGATLIAVGTHGHSRLSELLIGGVAGPLLRESKCSVLVARRTTGSRSFPADVVVGVDGSPASLAALEVGEYLGTRFGSSVRAVLARHGDVDVVNAKLHAPRLEIVDGRAVDVLVGAGPSTDLVIVGSRGLHGLATLGSVSERVAHDARSSVLVVRPQLTVSGGPT